MNLKVKLFEGNLGIILHFIAFLYLIIFKGNLVKLFDHIILHFTFDHFFTRGYLTTLNAINNVFCKT